MRFPGLCHPSKSDDTGKSGGVGLKWMPDSRTVAFIDTTLSNIWGMPIDGKAPYQVTKFIDGRTITDFSWSRDGKRLAISRSVTTNDIVLFKGLRH